MCRDSNAPPKRFDPAVRLSGMSTSRQWVLAGIFVTLSLFAAVILFDVLGTVFFAGTVVYVLAPLHRRLVARDVHPWWASAAATALAGVGVVALFVPFAVVLYQRQADLLALLATLPDSVTVTLAGYAYTVEAGAAFASVRRALTGVAIDVAQATPVLLVKLTLFVFLVFALLIHRSAVRRALLAPVPPTYHDVVAAFDDRVRETLFGIYVLQAATATGTFLIALPVFVAFGYAFPVTLAAAAGFLQFLPVVGPSLLIAGLVGYHLAVGQTALALAIGGVGFFFVAWLPDVLIRPRLARGTANLPGTLYFVGFTGGLLSLGPVGAIAGPLAVALLAEATALLATELNGRAELRSA